MRTGWTATLVAVAVLGSSMPARSADQRPDVIWARSTAGQVITLDGKLDEPAWALAETKIMKFAYDSGLPGSGWKNEGPPNAVTDSMYATLKFLRNGNQLYLGAVVKDRSVGGSSTFNREDGFLMAIKNHLSPLHPAPTAEHFYSWWYPNTFTPLPTTAMPTFIGNEFGSFPPETVPRTPAQIAAWDARTTVQGVQNSDAAPDTSYTVEMRFDVTATGYNYNQAGGDIVEWNISIYDVDWYWPNSPSLITSNRTWWQGPWGNTASYNEVRVYGRNDVTINSGEVPIIGPDQIVPNAGGYAAPTIDGNLNEQVWSLAPSFDIRYGDDAVRATYPGVGRWRGGQYQPTVNAGQAAVLDPSDATIKYFVKGNKLYVGVDARDLVVQSIPYFDRWDGFIVGITDRGEQGIDHNYLGRRLTCRISPTGTAQPEDYLAFLRDSLAGANVALMLKPGTTLDTLGTSADVGWSAELEVDLTKVGYPSGLGDRVLWWSVDLLDGDSFTPFTDSYGTRTWWFREYDSDCCPVWAYMDPNAYLTTGVESPAAFGSPAISMLTAFPNPLGRAGRLGFSLAVGGDVTLEILDVQGRLVARQPFGRMMPGSQSVSLAHALESVDSGLYFARVRLSDDANPAAHGIATTKLMKVR